VSTGYLTIRRKQKRESEGMHRYQRQALAANPSGGDVDDKKSSGNSGAGVKKIDTGKERGGNLRAKRGSKRRDTGRFVKKQWVAKKNIRKRSGRLSARNEGTPERTKIARPSTAQGVGYPYYYGPRLTADQTGGKL